MLAPEGERPARTIGALVALSAVLVATWGGLWGQGCASATAYLKGPTPPAALPDPQVRLVVRARAEDGTWSEGREAIESPQDRASGWRGPAVDAGDAGLEVAGTVTRVVRGVAPRLGFRVEVETPEQGAVLDVATFREMPDLDLRPGVAVTLVARAARGRLRALVRDDTGDVFGLFAGNGVPEPAGDGEFEVNLAGREAYREVQSGQDLCHRTLVHRAVRVRWRAAGGAGGGEEATLDPGETRILCQGQGTCRQVTLVDARETDEQECGTPEPPYWALWWSRVPAGTAAPP